MLGDKVKAMLFEVGKTGDKVKLYSIIVCLTLFSMLMLFQNANLC